MDITKIPENKGVDQFFYDNKTCNKLAYVIKNFKSPCLLCAPSLGLELEKQGKICRILDIDKRFSGLKGFKYYDINQPKTIKENYDIILCDPPFMSDINRLFDSINNLMKKDTIIAISWYQARLQQFLQIFSQLGLKPTGIELKYKVGEIEFYEKSYIEKFGKVFVQLYSNKPEMIKKLWNDLDVSP